MNKGQNMTLEFHPLANIFPLIDGTQFDELVADIRAHGVREPIWLYEGQIIDGRNRHRASAIAGVDCPMREYLGDDPVSFVVSLNLKRRHLNASQLAFVALEIERAEAELAKERQKRKPNSVPELIPEQKGEARDKAAAAVGVSGKYVSDAKAIQEKAPGLAEQIKRGEKTITEVKRQLRKEELRAKIPNVPTGKYRVIYADPPWKYNDAMAIGDGLGESYGPADVHYPPMTISELCGLPIADLADDNAVLFLWTTSPLLEDSFAIVRAWGFKYKSSFVWDKIKHNMGHYNSVRHEFLLVCTRGSCTPDVPKLFDSVQSIERTAKHSQKPQEFRDIIDTIYPQGNRIELFARSPATGWCVWGNEADAA